MVRSFWFTSDSAERSLMEVFRGVYEVLGVTLISALHKAKDLKPAPCLKLHNTLILKLTHLDTSEKICHVLSSCHF